VGSYYRLKELGYRLPAGAHILAKQDFAPIEDATRLLDDADTKAAEIVAAAEAAFQAERERGYQEGLAQGRLEAVERLLQESSTLDAKLREVERDLAGVVAACVRRLIDSFDDAARAEAIVRGALKQMRREKKAELRVSPAQVAHFKTVIGEMLKEFPEIELVDVVEDATLTAPQVILETSIGRVAGDFGARLAELENAIRGAAVHRAENSAEPDAATEEPPHDR
jgi:type III secretion protein L